jgi:MFS family permease
VGALGAASRQTVTGRGLLLWTVAFGVVNLLTAFVGGLMVALAALVAVGISNILFNTLARTLLQLHSDQVMQGRVMALHGLLFLGTTPIGGPLLGWVCATWGSEWAWVVAGATALAVAAAVVRPMWGAEEPTAQPVPASSPAG